MRLWPVFLPELSTKLGTAVSIEKRFKLGLGTIFSNLGEATIEDLIAIIAVAAKKLDDVSFRTELLDSFDYTDLMQTVSELIAHLMYGGTPEQKEEKIEKSDFPEQQKNAIRGMLGLPIQQAPANSTGNAL